MFEENYLEHYGIKRRSGRYPWGSGDDPYQRFGGMDNFMQRVKELSKSGMKETEIAKALGFENTTELRARKTRASVELRSAKQSQAVRLKDRGWSNTAIAKEMGINESSVRSLLNPSSRANAEISTKIAKSLKDTIGDNGFIDIGTGVERYLGTSSDKLKVATKMLEDEGYKVKNIYVSQLGTNKQTTMKVLAAPDIDSRYIYNHLDEIKTFAKSLDDVSNTGGNLGFQKPVGVDPSRVKIRYANGKNDKTDGEMKDGVIEINPSAKDLQLDSSGTKHYAQVRIQVGNDRYLKGMAMYGDPKDFKDGVDIIFNTNKHDNVSAKDVMKPLKTTPDGNIDYSNPFGSSIHHQVYMTGTDGKKKLTPINIVNQEGDWDHWSRTLPSQMVSKQSTKLAEQQLGIDLDRRRKDFDEINNLTNSVVRQKMLSDFANAADSAAVTLKAAALPRQRTQVILPIVNISEKEIYAPNFKNGESVALIRFPHGGRFEIPILNVNNKNVDGKKYLGSAIDAVGINAKVAERLSGADFDGDTVIVIPNNHGFVKNMKPLEQLKDFDPKSSYPAYEGMKPMTTRQKGIEMGKISNLITDMSIKGAPPDELARAVKHSMVVIDAEKHKLNWKQSEQDNDIQALKNKYQPSSVPGKRAGGPSTLISRTTSTINVPERKLRSAKDGGPIDKKTGKLVYENTNATYSFKSKDKDGNDIIETLPKLSKVHRMDVVDDARQLSSGTAMENIYASYANSMKDLANRARKEYVNIETFKYSPEAKKKYANEVSSLDSKLNISLKNAPLERQAQVLGNSIFKTILDNYPNLTNDEKSKYKARALYEARTRVGAHKQKIVVTDNEWNAIQEHAVSANKLKQILDNSDMDSIRKLATPNHKQSIPEYMVNRIKVLVKNGYTQAEVSDALGVSANTVNDALQKRG